MSGAVGLVVGHPLDTVKVSFIDNLFEVHLSCWFSDTDITDAADAFVLFRCACRPRLCIEEYLIVWSKHTHMKE